MKLGFFWLQKMWWMKGESTRERERELRRSLEGEEKKGDFEVTSHGFWLMVFGLEAKLFQGGGKRGERGNWIFGNKERECAYWV